jgi:hypothetical protein
MKILYAINDKNKSGDILFGVHRPVRAMISIF